MAEMRTDGPIAAVPEHRERLAEAARMLERQATRPVVDRRVWMEDGREAVVETIDSLAMHIDETEGVGGLYDEIMADKPRLAHAVDTLRHEHVELLAGAAALIGVAAVPNSAIDEARIREDLLALTRGVERHQRRGLDLLYEFYEVDIGLGE
jgi:hypothetical protein